MTDETRLPLFPDEPLPEPFVTVAKVAEVTEGRGHLVVLPDRRIAIFLVEGKYYAIDDFCPHRGASLASGYVMDGAVACPMHHWRFRLQDGNWLDNPEICIQRYNVRLHGQDIQVQIPKNDGG